jgi:putative flippase GtrA
VDSGSTCAVPRGGAGSLSRVGVRWQRFAAEVGRFLAVGLLATVVALLLFNVLVHGLGIGVAPLNSQPELAYLIANTVGMVISFRGMKTWAFKHRESTHFDGGVLAFVSINLVTMLIPMTCLWLSRNGLGLDDPISDNVSANVIGLALANAARFVLFRQVVFSQTPGWDLDDEALLSEPATGSSTSDPARPPAP